MVMEGMKKPSTTCISPTAFEASQWAQGSYVPSTATCGCAGGTSTPNRLGVSGDGVSRVPRSRDSLAIGWRQAAKQPSSQAADPRYRQPWSTRSPPSSTGPRDRRCPGPCPSASSSPLPPPSSRSSIASLPLIVHFRATYRHTSACSREGRDSWGYRAELPECREPPTVSRRRVSVAQSPRLTHDTCRYELAPAGKTEAGGMPGQWSGWETGRPRAAGGQVNTTTVDPLPDTSPMPATHPPEGDVPRWHPNEGGWD
jgi:hypothetical protein